MIKLEEIARAICGMDCMGRQSTGVNGKKQLMHLEEYVDIAWPLYAGHARAAIEALREPSDSMLEAGYDSERESGSALAAYRAMIEAASHEIPWPHDKAAPESQGPEMTQEQLAAMQQRMKPVWQPIADVLRGDAP